MEKLDGKKRTSDKRITTQERTKSKDAGEKMQFCEAKING